MEKLSNNFVYRELDQKEAINPSEVVLSDGQGSLPLGEQTYHPAWAKCENGTIQPILKCIGRKASFWPCGILKSWNDYTGSFSAEFKHKATTSSTEDFVKWWQSCTDFNLVVSEKTLMDTTNPYTDRPGRKARIDYR